MLKIHLLELCFVIENENAIKMLNFSQVYEFMKYLSKLNF